jgi:hypothetical protein
LTVGINEGTIDMPTAKQQLEQRGVVARTIDSILGALTSLFGSDKGGGSSGHDRRL